MEPLDMLIFAAHPDDAEIGMGGTIAKSVKAGLRVGVCDLTRAEMSSNGNVELRRQEAEDAAKILGLAVRTNLGLPDRGLAPVKEQLDKITREIRKFRPRLVFAPYWQDRHPDHVMAGRLVKEAVFNAKLRKYMPETVAFTVEQVFYYYINDVYEPDAMVDVTDVYEVKMAALAAYRSQFTPPQEREESGVVVKTPLNQGYLEQVEARDRMLGHKRLIRYAEGFASELPILLDRF